MRKLLLASLLLSALAVALSGCGGGGGSSPRAEMSTAAGYPTGTYFPLGASNWWHYKIGATAVIENFRFTGTTTSGGATYYVSRVSRPGGVACTLKAGWYRHSTQGLRFRALNTSTDVLILKPPLTAGATWTSGGRTFKIAEVGSMISVPAGVFGPCVVVEEMVNWKKLRTTYAPGPGIVQVTYGANTLLSLDSTSLQSGTAFLSSQLEQQGPGFRPILRVHFKLPSDQASLHGWLVYRAANTTTCPGDAAHLVDMLEGVANHYSDDPGRNDFTEGARVSFGYNTPSGLQEGSVIATFRHPEMVPGTRYFHRVKPIIDPVEAVGLAQTPTTPTLSGDPLSVLSGKLSNTCGAVTYFKPPLQVTPFDRATHVPDSAITFTWQNSVGANEYVVQVFSEYDPNGLGTPMLSSAVLRATGTSTASTTLNGTFDSTYYWRVGARQTADTLLPLDLRTGKAGWLYSDMRAVFMSPAPPGPPMTSR